MGNPKKSKYPPERTGRGEREGKRQFGESNIEKEKLHEGKRTLRSNVMQGNRGLMQQKKRIQPKKKLGESGSEIAKNRRDLRKTTSKLKKK